MLAASRHIIASLPRYPPAGRSVPFSVFARGGDRTLESAWPDMHAALFESGTSALAVGIKLALERLPAGAPPRVALPAYGCPNLAAAALWAGATLEYYDLSRDTFAADPEALVKLLAGGDRVVMHVDAFGAGTLPQLCLPNGSTPSSLLLHDLAQSFIPYEHGWRPQAHYNVLSLGRAKPASLTRGGILLVPQELGQEVERAVSTMHMGAFSIWQCAARSILYSASLHPWLFGVLTRVPKLGIGETRFVPLTNVRRLPLRWRRMAAVAVVQVQRRFDKYCEDTAEMLRLAAEAGVSVPPMLRGSVPLWRVPILCATPRQAAVLAEKGAHLGISRLYGRSLPELMGVSHEESEARWPNAVWLASRLITLPTHGRLRERDRAELRNLLVQTSRVLAGECR